MTSGSDILLTSIQVITDWPIRDLLVARDVSHRVPAGTRQSSGKADRGEVCM
ncbi:unnamed protein product [Staurois parvus]|uniref:Transposase n=1 Tax=Staurois parvus TaxID=386267 RepID=A0ABN9GRF7_9NEOB|nr:unnamed protein product [Staurois parvus]